MKYESAVLKRLIDTYGVVGNPRYISEIIKEFIVRGKECFPNLFTYQSDWLAHIDELGLSPTYTVSYTGQSIYAPNTLERPVKGAILKGSTKYRDIDTGEFLETIEEGRNLELVSVKMPVLKTTGKNLYDFKLESGNHGGGTNNIKCEPVEVEELTTYTISNNMDYIINVNFSDKNDNAISEVLGKPKQPTITFTTPQRTKYMWFRTWSNMNDINVKFQMEKGTQPTTYEPYKSNILTVNEPVELRGIGEVKDTLDCLNGQMTERIAEIVLDGSEGWESHADKTNTKVFKLTVNNLKYIDHHIISDRFPTNASGDVEKITNTGNVVYVAILKSKADNLKNFKSYLSQNPITVQYQLATESIKTVDLTVLDQNGKNVKQLMSFNGGTHFNTMSFEGSPLPTVNVSVETDLEETLLVCSLEGNTM